jgi:hypothetical protein
MSLARLKSRFVADLSKSVGPVGPVGPDHTESPESLGYSRNETWTKPENRFGPVGPRQLSPGPKQGMAGPANGPGHEAQESRETRRPSLVGTNWTAWTREFVHVDADEYPVARWRRLIDGIPTFGDPNVRAVIAAARAFLDARWASDVLEWPDVVGDNELFGINPDCPIISQDGRGLVARFAWAPWPIELIAIDGTGAVLECASRAILRRPWRLTGLSIPVWRHRMFAERASYP